MRQRQLTVWFRECRLIAVWIVRCGLNADRSRYEPLYFFTRSNGSRRLLLYPPALRRHTVVLTERPCSWLATMLPVRCSML